MPKQHIVDLRTDVEKEIYEILMIVLDYFSRRILKPEDFMTLIGKVRDARAKIENKRLGCISGRHSQDCLCSSGIPRNLHFFKRNAKLSTKESEKPHSGQ